MMVGMEELEDVLENIIAALSVATALATTTFYCHLFSFEENKKHTIFFKM